MIYSNYIMFDSIKRVNNFVRELSNMEGDIILQCGATAVDAKSILGVLSLGINRAIKCTYNSLEAQNVILKYCMSK